MVGQFRPTYSKSGASAFKNMRILLSTVALALCAQFGAAAANAAAFKDATLQKQFETGTLVLEHSYFGEGVGGGAALHELYKAQRWPELVEGVVSKKFISDLYYFYLGAAAEALGHADVALNYYRKGMDAFQRRDTCGFGLDSCRSVHMPSSLIARIDALENADVARSILVTVKSRQGSPIGNALVAAQGKREGATCVTVDDGTCSLAVALAPKEALPIAVAHEGMFQLDDSIPAGMSARDVTLRSYRDMLCSGLLSSATPVQVAFVEHQVELISLGAQLEGTTLEDHGICTSTFKKVNYLSFKLKNGVTFNENKLTSYAIGAEIFDEVVKKMLLAMVVTGSALNVDGYDIAVSSTKGNFVDSSVPAKRVNFRFYFPKTLVAKYKDKDISGQQLLDGSVILLNDDRVDLKLL
jgi:hypothetical protein